ncbi:hypothetical protein CRUP_017908, partial [Coryphaenoides rupestris]
VTLVQTPELYDLLEVIARAPDPRSKVDDCVVVNPEDPRGPWAPPRCYGQQGGARLQLLDRERDPGPEPAATRVLLVQLDEDHVESTPLSSGEASTLPPSDVFIG